MDTTPKHTPGPWNTCHHGDCPCGLVWSASRDMVVAEVSSTCIKHEGANLGEGISNRSEEYKANYRLIAAAPDMLEALQNLENDDNSIPEHAWKMVQDAIKKATHGH